MWHSDGMPKRTSKAKDFNQVAFEIVKASTEEPTKNPAAVALGRLGGLKGGPARAKKLSAKKRRKIAKLAATTRWAKKR